MERDAIIIRGLELPVRIGVPEAERAGWQVVGADVELELRPRFDELNDELAGTLDYQAVAEEIRVLAAARPRKLLETLAAEIVGALLRHPMVATVAVELRKRILPGVDHVSVRMKRAG
jgi:7,8-dihydroneopterin aldolase/epimerase/oxygenase